MIDHARNELLGRPVDDPVLLAGVRDRSWRRTCCRSAPVCFLPAASITIGGQYDRSLVGPVDAPLLLAGVLVESDDERVGPRASWSPFTITRSL